MDKNKIITASAVLLLCLLTGCKDAVKTVGAEQTVSDTSVTAETSETVKDCCKEDAVCCEETHAKDCCHNEETCCEDSAEKDCCDDKNDGDDIPGGVADCCG